MDYLRQAVFENATVVKVAHNLAFESMFLYALRVIVQPPCYHGGKTGGGRAAPFRYPGGDRLLDR